MFYMIGIGGASLVGAMLTDLIGFYNGQRLSAGIILLAVAAWYLWLPETRREAKPEAPKADVQAPKTGMPMPILISACFLIFIARFIDRGFLASSVPLWMAGLFGEGLQLKHLLIPIASLTGIYNAIKILPGIAAAPLSGALSDRMGKRWVVMAGGLLLGGIGVWLMAEPLLMLAVLGALVTPVIGASVESLVPAVVGDHSRGVLNGRLLGIVYIFADLGSTLGPMVGLGLLDAGVMTLEQLYHACFGLIVAVVITAVLTERFKLQTLVPA
jgi:MFS family permease